jgi:NADPH:quinone reductase-like Zn-dependent oxidoreductase
VTADADAPATAHAFWIDTPGQGSLHAETLAAPGPGEVQVSALYSGISRGTESLVFHGRVPESERTRMRAPFQAGDFPAPVKYGYANVGIVEAGPPELRHRTVFCLYPHQDRYVVPAEAVLPLPRDLPPKRAVMGANMETAVNALWDAAPRVGDRIAVVGAGTTGMLAAGLASEIPGTRVEVIDTDPAKRALAERLGLSAPTPDAAAGEADLVIHASGHPEGLCTALALAGFEATVLEMSWYGARDVPAPLGGAFHARRLTLASSQVGSVSPARRARWSHRDRLALALDLLRDPRFEALVTGESAFADLPETLARLADDPAGTLCHRIRYPAPD